MAELAQTLLAPEEIDTLARGLVALTGLEAPSDATALECSRLVYEAHPMTNAMGPDLRRILSLSTHLAELRMQG